VGFLRDCHRRLRSGGSAGCGHRPSASLPHSTSDRRRAYRAGHAAGALVHQSRHALGGSDHPRPDRDDRRLFFCRNSVGAAGVRGTGQRPRPAD
jgi:hypothetical protein